MSKYLTVKETAEYLKVPQKTIYRLLKSKYLTGMKTPGGWRISEASAERYKKRMRWIKYPGQVFTFPIVTQYLYASKKYQVITKHKGDVGRISLQPEYLKGLSIKKVVREYFRPIKYHRVYLANKYAVIVVSNRDLDRLPRAERAKWKRWQMKSKRLWQETNK